MCAGAIELDLPRSSHPDPFPSLLCRLISIPGTRPFFPVRRVKSNCATGRYRTVDSHHDICTVSPISLTTSELCWYYQNLLHDKKKWNCCCRISIDRAFYYAHGSHVIQRSFLSQKKENSEPSVDTKPLYH
jgi:hypothetical protein